MISFTEIGAEAKAPSDLVPFSFRAIGGEMLLTNDFGDWVFVSQDEFGELARGRFAPGSALFERLASRSFVRSRLDVEKTVERVRRKKRFLNYGPNLHILVVTLRCNETCVY